MDILEAVIGMFLKNLRNFRKTELPQNGTSGERNFRKREPIRNTNIKEISNIRNTNIEESDSGKFKKPTLEEVAEYCKERNNNVDPVKWFSHYEAKGWMIGKNRMKNWKAAVITWERSNFNSSASKEPDASKIDEALSLALKRAEGK